MSAAKPGYSVANANEFGWGSVGNKLNPARVQMLDQYVIGKRVLDAGCGGGGYVRYLSERGFDVVGIDYHEQFLALDQTIKPNYTLMQGDIVAGLPFPDQAFDTVICLDVLEHVDDVVAIQELARVAKQRLIIAVPQEAGWLADYMMVFATYRDQTHLRYYSESSLKALLSTITSKSVSVFGEQQVPFRQLMFERIKPRSRFRLMENLYTRLFRKIIYQSEGVELYMNLAAVIDI